MLLTTRINPADQQRYLLIVMVYDQSKRVWRLPGIECCGVPDSKLADRLNQNLQLNMEVKDLHNLNRSYAHGEDEVFIVGDETCRGLYYLDGVATPDLIYEFPECFNAETMEQRVNQFQSSLINNEENEHFFEVTKVCLVDCRAILNWMVFNNPEILLG